MTNYSFENKLIVVSCLLMVTVSALAMGRVDDVKKLDISTSSAYDDDQQLQMVGFCEDLLDVIKTHIQAIDQGLAEGGDSEHVELLTNNVVRLVNQWRELNCSGSLN